MDVDHLIEDLKLYPIYPISVSKRLDTAAYQLHRYYRQLRNLAPKFDFPGVPHNGLRSLLRIIDKFASLARKTLAEDCSTNVTNSSTATNMDLITNVLELLAAMAKLVVDSKRHELARPGEKPNDPIFLKDVSIWWEFAKQNGPRLASYFDKYTLFYIDSELRSFIVMCGKSFASLESPQAFLGSLVTSSANGQALSRLVENGSLYYPLRAWSVFDNPIVNSVTSWQASKYCVQATTIYVPRQKRWVIPRDGSSTRHARPEDDSLLITDKPVRCRLLKSTKYPVNGKLIIHISGGGFVMFKPEPNEGAYLRYWVGNLDGAVLLSIDYTKLVTYPVAFQDALDVYLWAASGNSGSLDAEDSVVCQLGFKPDKIVLCGDSAGSHLAFAICRAIRDIQNISPERPRIAFPSAFVSFYSNMTVNKSQLSLCLSCLETCLTPSVMLSIYGLIASGFVMDEDANSIDGEHGDDSCYLEPNPIRDNLRTWLCHGKNWFDTEPGELVKRFDRISRNASKAYLRPLTERDIDLLSDLPLFLIIGEFDFFLDGSVNLANSWKGRVKLDVLENLNHGFLSYSNVSQAARRGSRVGLQRLKEALTL